MHAHGGKGSHKKASCPVEKQPGDLQPHGRRNPRPRADWIDPPHARCNSPHGYRPDRDACAARSQGCARHNPNSARLSVGQPRFDQRRELVIGQLLQRFRHRGIAQIRRLGPDRRNPVNHIRSIGRITFQRITTAYSRSNALCNGAGVVSKRKGVGAKRGRTTMTSGDHTSAWAQIRGKIVPWTYPLSFLLRI